MKDAAMQLLVKEIENISGEKIKNYSELQDVIIRYGVQKRLSILWLLRHPGTILGWVRLKRIVRDASKEQTDVMKYVKWSRW